MQAIEGTRGQEGLTLDEIKHVASEAGIAPEFIDVASSGTSDERKAYMSIPTGVSRSIFVRGSLTEEAWTQMVGQFMRTLGGPGEVETTSNRRTWTRGATRITAEETGGQVVLQAEADWSKDLELPIALSLVGSIATLMMGITAFAAWEGSLGLIAMFLATLVSVSFASYRKKRMVRQEETLTLFESTLNRCAVLLQGKERDAEAGSVEAGSVEAAAPLLDDVPAEDEIASSRANLNKRTRA